ncbi:Lrp/AsnC family transcriptional regulator [Streptomyces sp. TM32]|uniref:Lrp/AsnC family transcriptional regulator n=1 Tax=Streptomyces sp. TM32 TaxID=1652669 RepID=UPI0010111440|nr:Lrp/AsnC family transcriptional regulator [Streptomyces sp. TM32]RXS87876.1 Lrp/AsnC family transcriptional regulator [Streptomyces sp. TM32]
MQDSFSLDEDDLSLINVMQIAPRATWTEVGKVLGLHSATVARRWERMTKQGVVWVTAYPNLALWTEQCCLAFIEVDCQPTARQQVVDALAGVPQIASVSQVASGRDLFLVALFPDLQALSQFVLDHVSQLPGVRGTRTSTATRFYSEGNKWRLQALSPDQRAHLTRHHPQTSAGSRTSHEGFRDLLLPLSSDGRRTAAELAALTSTSVSTTRRRLERMVREGLVSFRCEVSDVISGWPVHAYFWARVPAHELDRIAQTLLTLPEIRMCAAITGTDNLLVIVWLRSLGDSQRLETGLAERFPTLTLTERAIVLRMSKRMGWLLDDHGRRTSPISLDPWADIPYDPPPDEAGTSTS